MGIRMLDDQKVDALPVQRADYFAAALNPNEILIGLGKTTVSIEIRNGQSSLRPNADWYSSLSMSPAAALQLRDVLSELLRTYENMFGPIPIDPKFKVSSGVEEN